MKLAQVRIVGTGLIGSSIGLALAQQGISVIPVDRDKDAQRLAEDLLGGALGEGPADLTIIATPPAVVLEVLQSEFERNVNGRFIDVSSVKNNLLHQIESFPEIAKRFVGTHPMAGRERGGAQSAQSDLFQGRAWLITPTSKSEPDVLEAAMILAESLGAKSYQMTGTEHDAAMASISHLPQIVSTALASSIKESNRLDLAGQGLRDMTRLAASDAQLWGEILFANSSEVITSLDKFEKQIRLLRRAIEERNIEQLRLIFGAGASGKDAISGKHGSKARNYIQLLIVIEDKPGQLSRLFTESAEVQANIEDLSIEHSPGQETGLITLSFSPEDAPRVMKHLQSKSWKVHIA
jgi:prephenate dehydrogenase